jgi:hypothetical protein
MVDKQPREAAGAVDAAELLAGLDHSGGAPTQRHLPVPHRLTLVACSRQTEIIDSMAFVERKLRARVGGTPIAGP